MYDIIILLLAIVAWSGMFLVPASMAGTRRRRGKSVYFALFFAALVLELAITVGLMQLSIWFEVQKLGVVVSPTVGALAAGHMYWTKTNRRDKMTANNSLQPTAKDAAG